MSFAALQCASRSGCKRHYAGANEQYSLKKSFYCPIIVGGDLNVILDEALDGRGGNKKTNESGKLVEETWFTWRLDFWLVSDCL